MSNIVTAELYPTYDPTNYPYVGMSLTGTQYVLFAEKGAGVVLSGDREGEYSECFIECMFQPVGTRLDFHSKSFMEDKFPCVTEGDDAMSMFFLPYRLYFTKEKFLAFEIHDDGSVSFATAIECDYSKYLGLPTIDIELNFS